jgi:hypothetical protein
VASSWANPAQSPKASDAPRISRVFEDRVQAYVKLQKDLGVPLPAVTSGTEGEQLERRQDALALKIAAARRDARRGDLFTPDVAKQFRSIIRDALRGRDGRSIRRTILEGDPEKVTVLQVNVVYSEDIPLGTMPPMLLRRLPALPMELAYRFVGSSLVLKDVKTNLIVDFMPDAILRVR